MSMIEIPAQPTLGLDELLDRLQPATQDLSWSILEFWAVARDSATDVVALEQQAAALPRGLVMTGEELRRLAAQLLQFIDGIIVGYRSTPPRRSDVDLRQPSVVVIEVIDSTFWRIYAEDPTMLDRLWTDFTDVRDVRGDVSIPPGHKKS